MFSDGYWKWKVLINPACINQRDHSTSEVEWSLWLMSAGLIGTFHFQYPSPNTTLSYTAYDLVLCKEHPLCLHQVPSYGRQYQTCLHPYLMASANCYQSKIILSCSCLFILSNSAKYFETSAQTLASSFDIFRQLQLIFLHNRFACASSNSSKYRKSWSSVICFLQVLHQNVALLLCVLSKQKTECLPHCLHLHR